MTARLDHLDDDDQPCPHHPAAALDAILALATLGARTGGFNHDLASKIQGLMMSLEELVELLGAIPADAADALATAQLAVRELNQLLAQHRALVRSPARARHAVAAIATQAAARSRVELRGAIPDHAVDVSAPHVVHALALAIDLAAGDGERRAIDVTVTEADGQIELALASAPGRARGGEALALAAWLLAREHGALRCRDGAIAIRLPIAP